MSVAIPERTGASQLVVAQILSIMAKIPLDIARGRTLTNIRGIG